MHIYAHNYQNRNRVPIAGFNDEAQPLVKYLTHLAKPRIIANGVYDDTEAALAAIDFGWPKDWAPRVSREEIVTDCWESTCVKFRVRPPFTRKLATCVRALTSSLFFINRRFFIPG
jgi:hypothetical protein